MRLPTVAEYAAQIIARCPFPNPAIKPTFQKILQECAAAANQGDWQKALLRCRDAKMLAYRYGFFVLVPTEPLIQNVNPVWPDLPNAPVYLQFQRLELMIMNQERPPL